MKEKISFEICDCEQVHEDAVSAVRARMESREEYDRLADLMKLFGDGTRAQILHALEQQELCVCDLAALLGITKSAASHQLKLLRVSNLVRSRREGQNVFYALADDHVKSILDLGFEHLREEKP